MIIGIDPSYTGTGVCITNDDATEIWYMDQFDSNVSVYENQGYMVGCKRIYEYLLGVMVRMHEEHLDEPVHVIVEYPGFRSISGAWLSILHGYLCSLFDTICVPIKDLVWVPPTACDTYTKNKSHKKSYLTKYCVEHGWVPKKVNHDKSTALIFCHLYLEAIAGRYKGVTYRYEKC